MPFSGTFLFYIALQINTRFSIIILIIAASLQPIQILYKLNAMENSCDRYVLQVKKAKETVGILEGELHQIRLKLKTAPTNADFLRELKRITLDMTITLNELEHSQSMLDDCKVQYMKEEEKYND